MAIQEIIITGRKYRKCIDNTPNNKKWQRYSFWTKASDVWFDDGTTAQKKIGSFKGVTTNENQTAGYAADVTLVKSIKSSMSTVLTALQNRLNTVINNLGGLRFYEDSTGKYVVGADSVPKKLGNSVMKIKEFYGQWDNTDSVTQITVDTQDWENVHFGKIEEYNELNPGIIIIYGDGTEIIREESQNIANTTCDITQYSEVTLRVWFAKMFDIVFT